MSLVAYGASDDEDSDSSMTGNEHSITSVTEVTSSHEHKTDNAVSPGHISDEDDYHPIAQVHHRPEDAASSSHVSSTSASKILFSSGEEIDILARYIGEEENATSASLKSLPAPQKDSILTEDDLEEEVKPKDREIASAPKPPPKKSKQPVRITIPALEETAAEEENQGSKKNFTSSTKKSGLFSLLPAPIHSAKKEINRPLIPHSLGRKGPATVPTKKPSNREMSSTVGDILPSKHMSQFNSLTGYDSDSDDEEPGEKSSSGENFFSIDSSTTLSSTSLPKDNGGASLSETNSNTNVQSQEISSSHVGPLGRKSMTGVEESDPLPASPEPGAINDSPLDFGLKNWAGKTSAVSPVGSLSPSASGMYNMVNVEEDVQENFQPVPDDDLRQFMSDKEFQRFQGKRKRGMEEEINFVEANVDDYVDPSEVSKHLTEETEYVSHKSKDNLPTSQQKRKKQITYLAHQAKERELELKNQWAQNRHTKKQTQSKYGF